MSAQKWILGFGIVLVAGLAATAFWMKKPGADAAPMATSTPTLPTPPVTSPTVSPSPMSSISALPSALPSGSPSPIVLTPNAPIDVAAALVTDENGMSHGTVIIQTEKGLIKFKLYPKDAPNTVNRLVTLIQSGFYNGLVFHRVEPGFVIQGGDPTGTGKGGSGQKIGAEFNNRKHLEGTLSMARTRDPNSADSQFFVSLAPQPDLDHQYTIFGQVIEGMDVVRKVVVGDKMTKVWIQ